MNYLSRNLKVLAASALMLGVVFVALPNKASAQDCRAWVLPGNTYTSGITVSGNVATATFKIQPGCPAQRVSIASYMTHQSITPLSSQKYFSSQSYMYPPGTHKISTTIPANGCFYQVDAFRGEAPRQLQNIDYMPSLISWHTGGSKDCLTTPKPVTPAPVKPVETCSPTDPATAHLCPVKVEEAPAPEAAPVKEAPVVPEALPETGPAGVAAAFVGVSTFSTIAYNFARRRFGF